MKISCSQADLLYGIQSVGRAVSTRNTLPVLSGIYLRAIDGNLRLSATDLDIAIECVLSAHVDESGSIVLPARFLTDIIRKTPTPDIKITTEQNSFTAKIVSGKSEFILHGYNPEEFPILPTFEEEDAFSINATELKKAIQQTSFATLHDESRPVFTGQLFEFSPQGINIVATDGYRLAFRHLKIAPAEENKVKNVIVPGKSLQELSRVLAMRETETEIKVNISDNQIAFTMSDSVLISRLIEGQYPNYQQVVPQDLPISLGLNTSEFLNACERAALLSKDGPGIIKMQIKTDGHAVLTASSPEIGQTYEEITIPPIPEGIQIAFNVKYLIDALKAIDDEEVVFRLSAPLRPTVLRPQDNEEQYCVILPVKVV
jgi:DNA polymerase-3 subunit beta